MRQNILVENLIASLDVKEKARAKDKIEKENKGHLSADFIQRNSLGKNKGKNKSLNAKSTTTFKKKKDKAELPCFTCGELGRFSGQL